MKQLKFLCRTRGENVRIIFDNNDYDVPTSVLAKIIFDEFLPRFKDNYNKRDVAQRLVMQGIARKMLYDAEREATTQEMREFIRPTAGSDPVLHYTKVMAVGLLAHLDESVYEFQTSRDKAGNNTILSITTKSKGAG